MFVYRVLGVFSNVDKDVMRLLAGLETIFKKSMRLARSRCPCAV
jgi:hypothetical protein